VKHPIHLVWSK
jgi:Rrf2 family cysteine metabolism transcriptional repressor